MNILCTICSDLVNQAENVYVTKCGHLFHHLCLAQWIERSKTCPQCRNKVTDKCMFRLYPTVSNENSGEDAATLQSRLDDAQLQLRQQRVKYKEKEDKLAVANADLKRQDDLLKSYEKRLVSFDSKVLALREQLEFVTVQNKQMQAVKNDNEELRKNMQMLDGLQKVLNETSADVEQMLHSYTDVRTIATFATALKRALCDSEAKKNESRDRLHAAKQQLALEKKTVSELQNKVIQLEDDLHQAQHRYDTLRKETDLAKQQQKPYEVEDTGFNQIVKEMVSDSEEDSILSIEPGSVVALGNLVRGNPRGVRRKRIHPKKSNTVNAVSTVNTGNTENIVNTGNTGNIVNTANTGNKVSTGNTATTVNKVNTASKLYLVDTANTVSTGNITSTAKVNAGNTASTLLKVNTVSKHSIFYKKEPMMIGSVPQNSEITYDGLGGHSKLDTFPVANPPAKVLYPRLTAKHKLKRPNATGSQDIEKMLKKVKNN